MELTEDGMQNGRKLNKSWDSLDPVHHPLFLLHMVGDRPPLLLFSVYPLSKLV